MVSQLVLGHGLSNSIKCEKKALSTVEYNYYVSKQEYKDYYIQVDADAIVIIDIGEYTILKSD